jgi:UDP-N-acetylmuramoylalanine--D-glutamate ligase
MMDFTGKNVLVIGLGLNQGGLGVARYVVSKGGNVIVTDLKSREALRETVAEIEQDDSLTNIELVLGEHREQDVDWADYVVKNPAVPVESTYIQYAYEKKIPVITEFEMFFDALKGKEGVVTIGVTGTRGKSTTTAMIYHLLKHIQDIPVYLVGNIRKSALEILDELPEKAFICIEMSSFQLELLKSSPDVAVFTSLFPDHLDRHHTMEEYLLAKSHIFLYQQPGGKLIMNDDNHYLHHHLAAPLSTRVFRVSREHEDVPYILQDSLVFEEVKLMQVKDISIPGEHNQMNAALAVATVHQVLGERLDVKKVAQALQSFSGLPGRQELVGVVHGVKYINDTTSTMPDALITALRSFQDDSLVLIVGGNDKGLDYRPIKSVVTSCNLKKVILTPGTAGEKLKEVFGDVEEVESSQEAFRRATEIADEEDVVLFSPTATSFGEFRHEFDRGDAFTEYVGSIK